MGLGEGLGLRGSQQSVVEVAIVKRLGAARHESEGAERAKCVVHCR